VKNRTLDVAGEPDICADIRKWRSSGLRPESFQIVVAFEVVEHVDCFKEAWELLKPMG
jgi:2-polyprenyl-3-methyl-5-hydroxy-6-metoxy-1,4-benzoquinol methylase